MTNIIDKKPTLKGEKRKHLAAILAELPERNLLFFKRMYNSNEGKRTIEEMHSISIIDSVNEIPAKNLDWAIQQVYNTFINKLTR